MYHIELPTSVLFDLNDLLSSSLGVPSSSSPHRNRFADCQQSQSHSQPTCTRRPQFNRPFGANLNASRRFNTPKCQLKSDPVVNTISAPKDYFKLNLNVAEFAPSEVSLKLEADGRTLVVQAKHETRSTDGIHFEVRDYLYKHTLPENVISDQLRCRLDQNGHLLIAAPFKPVEQPQQEKDNSRIIPVEFVNKKASGEAPKQADEESKQSNPGGDEVKEENDKEKKTQSTGNKEEEVVVEDVGIDLD